MLICLIASLLLIAATTSRAADISEVGGTRNNGYFVLNRQIQFNCVYDNTAFVFVSFGHNGSRITSTGRFYIQDSHTHHSLVVSHTVPSDSGTWSCTLRSLVNQRTITRTTTVTYEESIVFTPADSSLVGAYGRPYTITCRGENIRTWQWIHDDAIVTNSSDGRLQVWSNGRIHFTSLQYGDTGVYYCKAANFYDFDEIATYRLTVNALPEVTVVKQPSNVIKANDALNITCTASGVGLVSVTWSKESDGGQLTSGSDLSVTTVFQNDTSIVSVLRFTAVTGSQQDTYRCNATSTAGSSYDLTEVSLSGLPGAPPSPSLSVVNVTMVRVRWETPVDTGNLNISHFQINYGKVGERGDQSPLQLELPAHHMEYVFSLLLATRYYFSVAAMNDHGRGPFSEQSEISTNSTIPDALTIMATDVTTDAVLLSWQPLTGNNTGGSPIIGYMITYYYDSGSHVTKSIDISEANNDSYWLTGLEDNAEYHVMICAVNINGCGEQSSLINFITPLSLPEPVSELSAVMTEDDKSITISWIAEDTNDQVYYIITITSQDDVVSLHNFTASMITVNGTINSVHVEELQIDKCYQINVTAVNEKGKSTAVSTNTTCSSANQQLVNVEGEISVSSEDDQLSSNAIITIAVPPVVLLLLVILAVVVFIVVLRRCKKYKKRDIEMGRGYDGKKRDSESSTAPINVNYHRNDSIDTQDSFGSQLSTPHTIDSFMSENALPFRMSTGGPLDPIRESPSIDEPSRLTSPEDGGMIWTVGPAEEEPNSPMTVDAGQPFIDAVPVYIDNPAYYSVSREYDAKLADNYSTVKIVPDKKNDGKEVVILPEKR